MRACGTESLGGASEIPQRIYCAPAEGERYEWTDMYDRFAKDAEDEGFAEDR